MELSNLTPWVEKRYDRNELIGQLFKKTILDRIN